MSAILADYIRTELKNTFGSESIAENELNKASLALAIAIQRYLTSDVKTVALGLQVDAAGLNIGGITNEEGLLTGIDVDPNPHSHSINPHRHDIVAP